MVKKNGITVSLVEFIWAAGLTAGAHVEEAMRSAIAAAHDAADERRLWLHATEMGYPGHKVLGFADGALLELHRSGA